MNIAGFLWEMGAGHTNREWRCMPTAFFDAFLFFFFFPWKGEGMVFDVAIKAWRG